MIEVTGLCKRYGSNLAVDHVSFSIDKGEVIGFLGPNGAGKSTIMNILTGYLSMTQGTVKIDGYDITENPEEAKKRIGYLPEIPPLYTDMKVREYLNFIYDLKRVKFPKKPHVDEVMKLVGIDEVQNRLIKSLSKGFRQRVGFAQALLGNPGVLILDEPTVGLDPKQILEIRNLIARLGRNHTVILSSHILSEIQEVCPRVLILNHGQIIADDSPEHLAEKLAHDGSMIARITGGEGEMLSALRSVNTIKNVVSLGSKEEGSFDYKIEPLNGADIRADVFQRVADRQKILLRFEPNSFSLEQVFLRLTETSDNNEARRLLGVLETTVETTEETAEEIPETEIPVSDAEETAAPAETVEKEENAE